MGREADVMSAVEQLPPDIASGHSLRLRMVRDDSHPKLDGGWWPRTRDPAREIQDLVWKFPPEYGRISRALFSPPDWDSAPRMVDLGTRYLRVGSFPGDDTHVIVLQTLSRRRLTLLVVPPGYSAGDAEAALASASASGNDRSGAEVLAASQPVAQSRSDV